MKPGDLYLSHDLPHHNQPTPDRALSFSGRTMLCMIKNGKVVDLFVCSKKICSEISQTNKFEICDNFFPMLVEIKYNKNNMSSLSLCPVSVPK